MKYILAMLALAAGITSAQAEGKPWDLQLGPERLVTVYSYTNHNGLECPKVGTQEKQEKLLNGEGLPMKPTWGMVLEYLHAYCKVRVVVAPESVRTAAKILPKTPSHKTAKSVVGVVQHAIISPAAADERRPPSSNRVHCPNTTPNIWGDLPPPNTQVCSRWPQELYPWPPKKPSS